MAIYNDISSQFDGSSFLRGAGEKSKGGLQKKHLEDILRAKVQNSTILVKESM